MVLAAGGAFHRVRIGAAPYQLLELAAAIVAGVFKNRHAFILQGLAALRVGDLFRTVTIPAKI